MSEISNTQSSRFPAGHGATTPDAPDWLQSWTRFPAAFRQPDTPLWAPWDTIFGPLRANNQDDMVLVGQIGQSLDGRVATASGHSHYINGEDGLKHLHRLRALMDAVVVGIGTALADDPQLTVRHVSGPQPARVVIDPRGRLPASARLLAEDGARRVVLTAAPAKGAWPAGVEVVPIEAPSGSMAPSAIARALHGLGFRRLLIEGGPRTISRFLRDGCLDRLHIVTAPVIIGEGPAGISLPPIATMKEALRMPVRMQMLGNEMLFDCDLSAQRRVLGCAKKST